MSVSISHQQPAQRAGADCCPGVDKRGHGLTASLIHDSQCCEEWESGVASPDRTEAFSAAAAQWGHSWPEREDQAAAAEVDYRDLSAMGPEPAMTEPAPCCGYPELEAGQ